MGDGRELSNEEYWCEMMHAKWGGSCFGMSAVYCLAKSEMLEPETFQQGAELLHDLKYPKDSVNVRDPIQYYYLMQCTFRTMGYRAQYDPSNEAANLRNLIQQLDTTGGYVFLGVALRNFNGKHVGGHAIVAESYTKGPSGYGVVIWDPNNRYHLTFDQNFQNAAFNYLVSSWPQDFVTYALAPDAYNVPDLTGIWGKGTTGDSTSTFNYSVLSLDTGDFRIETGNGQYAVVKDGIVTDGTLKIRECTPEGTPADGSAVTRRSFFYYGGTGVEEVVVTVAHDAGKLSLLNGKNYYTVDGDSISKMPFPEDCVSTSAASSGVETISMVSDSLGDAWNKVAVSGSDTAFTVTAADEQVTVASAHQVSAAISGTNVSTRKESMKSTVTATPAGVTLSTDAASLQADAAQGMSFTDVAAGAYYYDAVQWAVKNGVTTATTFSPNNPCTRAQIVTFLYRDLGTR